LYSGASHLDAALVAFSTEVELPAGAHHDFTGAFFAFFLRFGGFSQ
jgi:hypothetical protein